MTREGHGTEIELLSVQYDDAGTYRCTASNTEDDQHSTYEDLTLVVECTFTILVRHNVVVLKRQYGVSISGLVASPKNMYFLFTCK